MLNEVVEIVHGIIGVCVDLCALTPESRLLHSHDSVISVFSNRNFTPMKQLVGKRAV